MPLEPIVHRLGGGDDKPIEFYTDGQHRLEVHPTAPALTHRIAATEPTAKPQRAHTYFRLDASGKQQFCVAFASGAVQVLATEP